MLKEKKVISPLSLKKITIFSVGQVLGSLIFTDPESSLSQESRRESSSLPAFLQSLSEEKSFYFIFSICLTPLVDRVDLGGLAAAEGVTCGVPFAETGVAFAEDLLVFLVDMASSLCSSSSTGVLALVAADFLVEAGVVEAEADFFVEAGVLKFL